MYKSSPFFFFFIGLKISSKYFIFFINKKKLILYIYININKIQKIKINKIILIYIFLKIKKH
jgi:hypothetical protein